MTKRRAASRLVVRVAAACVLLLTGPLLRPLGAQENWAGKLGYGNNRKVFIIHADDGGSFEKANYGIQTLLTTQDSVMQSTSLMVPAAYYDEFVGWYNTYHIANPGKELDVGLHLTLNSEWKTYRWGPAFRPPDGVKHILENNFLCFGWKPLLPRKAEPYLMCRAPASVAREQAAQIMIATEGLPDLSGPALPPLIPAMDPKPSHLDSHMGTAYVRKSHFERYLLAARIYGIPAATFQNWKETLECMDKKLNPDPNLHSLIRIIARHVELEEEQNEFEKTYSWPFPRVDRICAIPYGSDLDQTRQNFKEKVNDKIGPGITQFLYHPSDEDAQLRAVSPEKAKFRIDIDRWLFDGTPGAICSPEPADLPTFLKCTGPVVNWRKLQKRYDHIVRDKNCSAPPGDTDPYVHPVGCP